MVDAPESHKDSWIRTFTGKRFHFLAPSIDEICVEDIAHQLALRNRFCGATRYPYSVAMHSIVGAVELLAIDPALAKAFLFHDAAEAYLPDIPSPLKHLISNWSLVEDRIIDMICEKFSIDPLLMYNPGISKMDRALRDDEGSLFVKGYEREFSAGPSQPLRSMLVLVNGTDWREVERRFLKLAGEL